MNDWKSWQEKHVHPPQDDENYLISWLDNEGKYHVPHKAYWIREEGKFFSLENNNSHPLHCDIYMEMPKTPKV